MAYKVFAFAVGSATAAVAGAYQVHYQAHISPEAFGFFQLVNYLIFVMIGGSKHFVGPIIGAFVLTLFSEFMSQYQALAIYQSILYGLALILVVIFFPDGLASLPERIKARKR